MTPDDPALSAPPEPPEPVIDMGFMSLPQEVQDAMTEPEPPEQAMGAAVDWCRKLHPKVALMCNLPKDHDGDHRWPVGLRYEREVTPAAPASPEQTPGNDMETGRQLASKRDDLIAQGVNPADLEIPAAPASPPATEDGVAGLPGDHRWCDMEIRAVRKARNNALARVEGAEGEAAWYKTLATNVGEQLQEADDALADARRVIAAVEALCRQVTAAGMSMVAVARVSAVLSPPAEASPGDER